jgi:hypothetical protein
MTLAQFTNANPQFLKDFIIVVVGILGLCAAGASIYGVLKKRRIEPQPLEVRAAQDFVTREFCGQMHAETVRRVDDHTHQIERIWNTIKADKDAFEVSARARSAKIYEKIDEIRQELSEANVATRDCIGKGFQDVERAIGWLEGKIDGKNLKD